MTALSLAYDGYDPAEEGQREALCTLGNGFFACGPTLRRCRRSIPCASGESRRSSSWPKDNRLMRSQATVVENESMVNLPNWLMLTFAIDEGPWIVSCSPATTSMALRSTPAGTEPCQNRRRQPSVNLARREASTCCWNVMCWRGRE